MLLVPLTATASHNSVGAHAYIVQADEVDTNGNLLPDVGASLLPSYHADTLPTPRSAPQDQSGDRYTDCQQSGAVDEDTYRQGLLDGTSCYVGYLDQQKEYLLFLNLFLVKQPSDDLYPANPSAGDAYCQGTQDTETVTGNGAVDTVITRVNRSANDPECSGSGHSTFIPGDIAVDTNLMEAGAEGIGNVGGAGSLVSSQTGSGFLTLPGLFTPYHFIFGQPHPANPNPSTLAAGAGPFGPNPANGGSPLFDLTNACGQRTLDCRLLTPEDIKLYDQNNGNLDGITANDARVCSFSPQFVILNPDERDGGLCGVSGRVVDQFVTDTSAGGLDIPGVPSTWTNVLPGWYEGVITASAQGEAGLAVRTVDEYQCAADDPAGLFLESGDCDGENSRISSGLQYFTAINPKVPTDDHALWCIQPNILAEGGTFDGVNDPGVYGSFIADAVDVDVYRRLLQDVHQQTINNHHSSVRSVLITAETGVFGAVTAAENAIQNAPVPQQVRDLLLSSVDRASTIETQDAPDQYEAFQVTRAAGIQCDAQGLPQVFPTDETIDGDLIVDTQVSRTGDVSFSVIGLTATQVTQTTALKDPTVTDGSGLPAGESDTSRGAWMARQYSFGGTIKAFLDTSQDAVHGDGVAAFSGCALPSGAVQPNADVCAWEPLWDGYNPDCTGLQSTPCNTTMENRNYDLDAGVGLTFTLKVTGPFVLSDEDLARPNEITDRTQVIGLGDATAQNCVVGFSIGLPATLGQTAVDEIVDDACQGTNGQVVVLEDVFDDQSPTGSPGQFSAAVDFAKLAPTPDASVDAIGFGAGDEVCVTGLWNVVAGETAGDTKDLGSFALTGDGSPYTWSDCFEFESTV